MKDIAIKPTTSDDIPALKIVVDETELFPGDMLPEMLSPFLGGGAEAVWLTAHLGGAPVGLCYAVPEELTRHLEHAGPRGPARTSGRWRRWRSGETPGG